MGIMTDNNFIKELYKKGINVSEFLRENHPEMDLQTVIRLSYEAQSGSYSAAMDDKPSFNQTITQSALLFSGIIQSYCNPETLLEAGVGEGTTLYGMNLHLGLDPTQIYGFDISWSRLALGKAWLKKQRVSGVNFCTGNLLNIPFADNSFDVVYTCHSIEPNRGFEHDILKELYRVAGKYLFLFEPSYEFARSEGKLRMDRHNYVKYLDREADKLGYEILDYSLLDSRQSRNPTSVIVIKKEPQATRSSVAYACPSTQSSLKLYDDYFFSPESLTAYPVLCGIPCLRIEDGIVAFYHDEFVQNR